MNILLVRDRGYWVKVVDHGHCQFNFEGEDTDFPRDLSEYEHEFVDYAEYLRQNY